MVFMIISLLYNKAPLIFLSDLFYWKDTNHPFYNIIQTEAEAEEEGEGSEEINEH